MSESVIICAIVCITIVMVCWIASQSVEKNIEPKDDIFNPRVVTVNSEDTSDKIKYMMCGEALQNKICNQMCYKCAWHVEKKNLMEEKKDG